MLLATVLMGVLVRRGWDATTPRALGAMVAVALPAARRAIEHHQP